jgi:hypothetical protein
MIHAGHPAGGKERAARVFGLPGFSPGTQAGAGEVILPWSRATALFVLALIG